MRKYITTALVLGLLVAGCSKPAPAPVSTPPVPTVEQSAPPPKIMTVNDWNDQALTLIRQGQWTEARAAAQRALDLDRQSSAAWFNLGRAQLGAGMADEALKSLQEASRLTGGRNADVEYYRGQAATAAGKRTEAIRIYRHAIIQVGQDKEIVAALEPLQSGGRWLTFESNEFRLSYPDYFQVTSKYPPRLEVTDEKDVLAWVAVEPFPGAPPANHEQFLKTLNLSPNRLIAGTEHKMSGVIKAYSVVRTVWRGDREYTASELHLYLEGRRISMACEAWSPLFTQGAIGSVCSKVEKSFQPKL